MPAGVLVGIAIGLCLRPLDLSPEAVQVASFPGEIMLRLLKMLVLPLVAGSMVAGKPTFLCHILTLKGRASPTSKNLPNGAIDEWMCKPPWPE